MACAIIAAAGKGSRAGISKNKVLAKIDGKRVIEWAVDAFLAVEEISRVIVCASREDFKEIEGIFRGREKVKVVLGGETRMQSVYNGLIEAEGCDIALIHDGARPFVSQKVIKDCIESVRRCGSGVASIPMTDTVCEVDGGFIAGFIDRKKLFHVQTPQGFLYKDILAAYKKAGSREEFIDDSSVYLKYFGRPRICEGSRENVKLTFLEDFCRIKSELRVGTGYDSHRFYEGRKFMLGGVEIGFDKGLLGHSDGDALLHAIIDSMFSAAGLSDIGTHFPDTCSEYEGISSMKLLAACHKEVEKAGFKVANVSAAVLCQRPKLAPYIPRMRENIANALGIDPLRVGISAKTNEGMEFVGEGEGIAVLASCLLQRLF